MNLMCLKNQILNIYVKDVELVNVYGGEHPPLTFFLFEDLPMVEFLIYLAVGLTIVYSLAHIGISAVCNAFKYH